MNERNSLDNSLIPLEFYSSFNVCTHYLNYVQPVWLFGTVACQVCNEVQRDTGCFEKTNPCNNVFTVAGALDPFGHKTPTYWQMHM